MSFAEKEKIEAAGLAEVQLLDCVVSSTVLLVMLVPTSYSLFLGYNENPPACSLVYRLMWSPRLDIQRRCW